jgi:hypothetical protein
MIISASKEFIALSPDLYILFIWSWTVNKNLFFKKEYLNQDNGRITYIPT